MSPKKHAPLFCIIDASSFVFRAYYAIRHLSNSAGTPTNATFGFANMILKALETLQPEYLAVVFDTKEPSYRNEIYPEYKANRGVMPEDLVPQMPYIKGLVQALGLPFLERPGFEADDIIATLAKRAEADKTIKSVCIVSSDKDLMQLVHDKTYMYDTMKEVTYDRAAVEAKMGVPPEQVLDFLSLVGDSSDNIPGVKGIGPKTAVNLLKEHKTLDGLYENVDSLKKSKMKENLITLKDNAYMSRDLARLTDDLDLEVNWDFYACKPEPSGDFIEMMKELELQKIADRARALSGGKGKSTGGDAGQSDAADSNITANSGDSVAALKARYTCLHNIDDLKKAFKKLEKSEAVAFDTETDSLNVTKAKIVGFSFCADDKEAFYVPVDHSEGDQCDREAALKLFQEFLNNKKCVAQNAKYDYNVMRSNGFAIKPEAIYFDTMIASFILDAEGRHGLDTLALKHFEHENIKYESVCGKGRQQISFREVPLDKATDYAAEDAHVTWLLFEKFRRELDAIPELAKIFEKIEIPLITVLADMEYEGIRVDSAYLGELSLNFAQEIGQLEHAAHELAGEEFNLASPKQLQVILFEKMGLPAGKKTKTGYSTNVDVLKRLALTHELPAVILNHREISKLKSTYVDVLPELADENERVHTSYMQTGAATGRLSSVDPNLQNIPIRTELGKKIRESFIPRDGWYLIGADYSQIELRVLAQMCGDEVLIKAFQNGDDIHNITAHRIFGADLDDVDPDQRRKAKAINFGLIYGKSAFSLAEELAISRAEAAEIIREYFAAYPKVKAFLDDLPEQCKQKGYSETWFGRRRPIAGIRSANKIVANAAARVAMNSPLQGTAADLIKLAMLGVHKAIVKSKISARMLLQVHDELVLEAPENEIDTVREILEKEMPAAGKTKGFREFSVPLEIDVGVGKDWLGLK